MNKNRPAHLTFLPPKEAKLVDSFPERGSFNPEARKAKFLGKQAPDISLKEVDGNVTRLSAYQGKPIFIEFWATWCAPCIELMPGLKELYQHTAPKGLVWMSIDTDEDPDAATAYLKKERISWANYHDEDGLLGQAFGREGIPLGVLVNAKGKITFYKAAYNIKELRAAIAKLSPPIESVATSAEPHPK